MFKYKKITLIIISVLVFFSNAFMYAESINDEEVFIKNGSRDKKLIALTFDDGPHPKETNQVLDVLNKYNIKGTFFVAGKHANWYSDPLIRANKEGHEIGNHTFNHPDITHLTNEQLEEEILKCEEILIKLTGKKPTLFRPPYGSYNDTVKTNVPFPLVLWSIDTMDWNTDDPNVVYENAIGNIEDGDVILLHEVHESTIEALPMILEALKEKGYQTVTIEEMYDMQYSKLKRGVIIE